MKPAQHPRLLLAASLFCTFSLVAVIGYHVTPSGAAASVYLPAATPAEQAALREELDRQRARRAKATSPMAATASAAAAPPASRAVETPGYTLAGDGTGLVPTELPGAFVDAEADAEPAAGTPAPASMEAPAEAAPGGFSMPGPRRPASPGSRNR